MGDPLKYAEFKQKVKASPEGKKRGGRTFSETVEALDDTLPPPKNGSLRQVASACAQRLQAALQVNTQTDSTSALSPLAQRIRSDIKI